MGSLEARGDFARGLERLDEVMPTARRVLGPDHPDIADLEVLRGRQLRFLGRADEAEISYREALRIERQVRGPDHPYVGYALIQLGVIQAQSGRLGDAERSYQEALRIYRTAYPEGDRNVANTLGKLAELALLRDRPEDAVRLARQSRALFGRLFPDDHPELLEGEVLIAISLAAAGHADEARPLLEGLLPRVAAVAGENSSAVHRIRQVLDTLPPADVA